MNVTLTGRHRTIQWSGTIECELSSQNASGVSGKAIADIKIGILPVLWVRLACWVTSTDHGYEVSAGCQTRPFQTISVSDTRRNAHLSGEFSLSFVAEEWVQPGSDELYERPRPGSDASAKITVGEQTVRVAVPIETLGITEVTHCLDREETIAAPTPFVLTTKITLDEPSHARPLAAAMSERIGERIPTLRHDVLPAIDITELPDSCPPITRHAEPLVWGTAIGAWGDTLAAVGNVIARLGRAGILHYGFDPQISVFLEHQECCERALWLKPLDVGAYARMVARACEAHGDVAGWIDELVDGTGIDPARIRASHVDFDIRNAPVPNRWYGARLPADAFRWAEAHAPHSRARIYLLQPFSTQSVGIPGHWPHWCEAIRALLSRTPHTYVLVGQAWAEGLQGQHSRLVNLLDAAPSMAALFALASMCDGVITTSNSLSMWTVIQGIPAVVCCNRDCALEWNYFRRWIETEPNRLIMPGQGVEAFMQAVESL